MRPTDPTDKIAGKEFSHAIIDEALPDEATPGYKIEPITFIPVSLSLELEPEEPEFLEELQKL